MPIPASKYALSDAQQSSHERTRLHNWNHSTLPEGVSVSFFSSRLLQFFILFASVVSFYTSKPVLCVCVCILILIPSLFRAVSMILFSLSGSYPLRGKALTVVLRYSRTGQSPGTRNQTRSFCPTTVPRSQYTGVCVISASPTEASQAPKSGKMIV